MTASGTDYRSLDAGTTWSWRGSLNQLTLTALAVDTPAVTGVPETPPPPLAVGQPWPNPARAGAALAIPLTLAHEATVTVGLFDTRGRLVAHRAAETLTAGAHNLTWDAGLSASGVYLARVEATPPGGAPGLIAPRRWVVAR